jgi:putative toxin-antitoxin system antitoxin component (TIGR02293 family)
MSVSNDLVRETALILGFNQGGKRAVSLQELRKAVDRGLPEASADLVLKELTPDGRKMLTLIEFKRHKRGGHTTRARQARLAYTKSEQTARLARVLALSRYVWNGNKTKVNRFLTKPHPMLGNEPPLKVAQSEIGARQVEDILWKIVYGLPA